MESKEDLHKVSCPTLILQGDHDTMTARQQKEMANKIPRATLVYIENAHHATNLDNPQQVNKQIMKHLVSLE